MQLVVQTILNEEDKTIHVAYYDRKIFLTSYLYSYESLNPNKIYTGRDIADAAAWAATNAISLLNKKITMINEEEEG